MTLSFPPTASVTESQIFTALRNFLLSVVPSTVEVFKAQANRVPEPAGVDFIEMTPMFKERLATNIDLYADNFFVGSITGTLLTITEVIAGSLGVGSYIYGVGVTAGTYIKALGTGHGGVGNYTVNISQSVASESLQAGGKTSEQDTEITVQLDIHGPASADNAQIISTLFRDEYAAQQFDGTGVSPLYAGEPRQIPFLNGEQQIEQRWIVDAVIQINPIVNLPQQFSTVLGPAVIHDVI